MKTVTKNEFSGVLKIGQTVGLKTYSKDDYYQNFNGEKILHLNALAWEAPSKWIDENGEEHMGYCPDDPFYDEIIETFKSFPDKYRDNFKGGTIVRKIWPDTEYDIIITWYSEVKMISWHFCKSYEYSI